MAEINGAFKTVKIVSIILGIVMLLLTLGATYGNLNTKMNAIDKKAEKTDKRSYYNEKAIISLKSDIMYIKEGVDELRGKK